MEVNETGPLVSNDFSSIRFFSKEIDYIACVSELLSACIVVKDTCIDAISFTTGALVCRIVPELTSQGSRKVSDQYSHFFLSDCGHNCRLVALRTLQSSCFEICIWDLITASLLRKLAIEFPKKSSITGNAVFFDFRENSVELFILSGKRLAVYKSEEIDLKNINNESIEVKKVVKIDGVYDVSEKSIFKKLSIHEYFGFNSVTLIYVDTEAVRSIQSSRLARNGGMTSLCTNQEKKIAAVGTEVGKIVLIHNLCVDHSKWIYTSVHWHTLPVLSLAFNTEGSMLYSGGSENVLVFWPVQDTSSKDFLPRVSAPINFIHPVEKTGELICGLGDNSIMTVTTSRNIGKQFAFFVKEISQIKSKQTNLRNVVKTFSNQIVAKSHPGMIQFSKPESAFVTMELDVCQYSYIAEREPKPHWDILAFDVSEFGHVCTLEYCQVKSLEQAVLKFWIFNETQFVLDISVNGIKFYGDCTKAEIVARSGSDSNEFVVLTDAIRVWTSAPNGSYRLKMTFVRDHLNDLMPNCLCFSSDGSLLMGNYGKFLMTWNCHKKYNASVRTVLPTHCNEVITGKNQLTAQLYFVSYTSNGDCEKNGAYKNKSEIRSLQGGNPVWTSTMSCYQLGAASSLPSFVAFCPDTNSVNVLLARMTSVLCPVEFSLFQYSLDSVYTSVKPIILPAYDPYQYQTNGNRDLDEDNQKGFFEGHNLVLITEDSKLLVLENKEANQPFSLLQTDQFETETAPKRTEDLLDSRKRSIVDRMRASQNLHKYSSQELYEYPSLLLPSVDEISAQLFSFAIDGYKNQESASKTRFPSPQENLQVNPETSGNEEPDADDVITKMDKLGPASEKPALENAPKFGLYSDAIAHPNMKFLDDSFFQGCNPETKQVPEKVPARRQWPPEVPERLKEAFIDFVKPAEEAEVVSDFITGFR